ncbi:MAG: ThiF family adenylyltransferase [Paenirhodobacter sp.]|uniref:HesA/MoeB/ThiF family protein n=1 Tax=Paenirhodobacter sp. TaxID=1965326 RepID=UPI003D0F7284
MTGLVLLAALLALGLALRAPGRIVLSMLGLLWAGIVLVHLLLPEGNPLRATLGGSLTGWLALGVVAVLVLAYRAMLRALRARAITPPARAEGTFSEAELDRYARHILLREVGGPGQRKLKAAKVLVVGAGGLGSPVLLYLAAAGVGTIGIVDDDAVSSSNLQRQVLHRDADIGKPKVFSAEAALTALNPFIEIRPYNRRLTEENAAGLIADYDLVIDGCDNFETRHLVNRACVEAGKPLLSGAITQWEGQLSLYDPARGAPCLACVFPVIPAAGLAPSCAEAGVMGALPGIVGAMMAAEAIKEITGAGATLRGRLVIHDALWGESRQIAVKRDPACKICGAIH